MPGLIHSSTIRIVGDTKTSRTFEYRRQYVRAVGPYDSGQSCFKQRVSSVPLNQNGDWHEVLPDDGFDGNRGDIWPASEMNQFRIGNIGGFFTDEHIIIRRARSSSNGDLSEVFGCRRSFRDTRTQTIILPLSSKVGALEGFIGFVEN